MFHRHYIDVVESTNDWLKNGIENHTIYNNYLIFTQHQTNGRGQFGRTWEMQPGLDLAFSFFVYPENASVAHSPALHSMTLCLALHQTFVSIGVHAYIKWPNDLIVEEKKISGILIESIYVNRQFYFINGIGVNLNSERLAVTGSSKSISVKDVLKQGIHAEKFLDLFEENFKYICGQHSTRMHLRIYEMYHEYLYKKGQVANLLLQQSNTIITCKISHVDEAGRLVVEHENSLKKYHHGEVKWVP